jgi:hypothetical protein
MSTISYPQVQAFSSTCMRVPKHAETAYSLVLGGSCWYSVVLVMPVVVHRFLWSPLITGIDRP